MIIRDYDDLLKAAGGIPALAEYVGCVTSNIYHWRNGIPSRYFNEFENRFGRLPRSLFIWWRP